MCSGRIERLSMPTSSADPQSANRRKEGSLLRVDDVDAGYGHVPVLHNVSMTVAPGEIVAVVGPNGAGKSTLLKTVLGILSPTKGQVTLRGEPITGLTTDRIARLGLGYVPQIDDVFETMTVQENLEVGGYSLPRNSVANRAEELYEFYPTLATMRGRYAGHLSGGERKMLAMARVLMTAPSLLVLDEPSAGLSPQRAKELLGTQVPRLAISGVAVLLVEQRTRDALSASDWAYVMASGSILLSDAADSLLARPDLGDVILGRGSSAAAPSSG
jgi:ABC-type branched-subunit amino acid transport system ATPase component